MSPEAVEALFAQAGGYRFARWQRPIVPVVFGVEDETLGVVKGAIEAVVGLVGHKMAETDPEMGANLMVFFLREWSELLEVPDLGQLIPDLEPLVARLEGEAANQYRAFRFEESGAIRACFVFLRMDEALQAMSAEALCLAQAVQAVLLWGERAFAEASPLVRLPEGKTVLRPDIAAVIQAGYDPVMPVAATDTSHALRLAARLGQGQPGD